MGFFGDVAAGIGSATGWLGQQAKVLPGVGGFLEATGSSVEALLSGGTVQTAMPGGPVQQYGSGAAAVPAQTGALDVIRGAKIAGVPIIPALVVLGLIVVLSRKGR